MARTVRRAGRPSLKAGERAGQVAVRFPPSLLERIDAKRAERIDEPDRSAMIRELVALGLEALDRKGRK